MNEIKVILFYETNLLVAFIPPRLTFRITGYKDTTQFGVLLLLMYIYNDFKSYLSDDLLFSLQKIEEILEKLSVQSYLKEYHSASNRFIDIFGESIDTLPDREDTSLDIGMSAIYEKKHELCTLNDICFSKLKTNLSLNFSEKDMFYFSSNLLFDRAHWYLPADFHKILDMDQKSQYQYISNFELSFSWEDNKERMELYFEESRYLLTYFKEIYNKLLFDKITFEYLLTLNGTILIGFLIKSDQIRSKFVKFFSPLYKSINDLPREWKAISLLILDLIDGSEIGDFYWTLQSDFKMDHKLLSQELAAFETDELGIFKEFDKWGDLIKEQSKK